MKDIVKSLIVKIDVIRVGTAFTVMAAFIMIVHAVIYVEIPDGNQPIAHNLMGIIEGAVLTVVTYEFGSSKGAQPKDKGADSIQSDKVETPKP